MRLFDSHAHLTDQSFAAELDDVLARAAQRGVDAIVTIASNLEDARTGIQLARATPRPQIWATAGLHPHEADSFSSKLLVQLEALAGADVVVAIGETGLDFYYENAPRQQQVEAFRAQLDLAARLDLPVVVHSRDADQATAALLSEFAGRTVGVLHCFSGGPQLLEAGLSADWYVSFSGMVTFKNFTGADALRRVPADRLLLETDSPYLAPAPKRGRRNEPAFVEHVVRRVAEIRGQEPEAVAQITYHNARRFYKLDS